MASLLIFLWAVAFAAFFAFEVAIGVGVVHVCRYALSRLSGTTHTAWLTHDLTKDVAFVLAAAQAPFLAHWLFGWWIGIAVFGLCGAAALLYASCYRAWLPHTGAIPHCGSLTVAHGILTAVAVVLFGLLGYTLGSYFWAEMSRTQKLALGAFALALLYWGVYLGPWWRNAAGGIHPVGKWMVRAATAIYVLYVLWPFLGLKMLAVEDLPQKVQARYDSVNSLDPWAVAAVLVLLLALTCFSVSYKKMALFLGSIAALGFLVWNSGIMSELEFSLPQFSSSTNNSAIVADNGATAQRTNEKPYVQGWVGNNYPRLSANYHKLSKEEQEAEREDKWGLIEVHGLSNIRSTDEIGLPGSKPEQYSYFIFRVHGDNATVTCFYDHGKPAESYRLNRGEGSCSGEGMRSFKVASHSKSGKHTFRFAFIWAHPTKSEPRLS